jgi:N-acetylneuraminic acid mutarotase
MQSRSQVGRRRFLARSLALATVAAGLIPPAPLGAIEVAAEKKPAAESKSGEKKAAEAKPVAAEDKSALPALPQPISSFGAVRHGDWVYVYSGHTGGPHKHSKKNLALHFQRINLASPKAWEALPMGPGLQSVALVAHGDSIYRVGGLSALNEPNEKENLVSVTDFQRFDPTAKSWTPLEPLPAGRSSHDAIVVGSKLYVVGGWDLKSGDSKWHSKPLVLDLTVDGAKWQELAEQPFQRRALAVAALDGKLYAIGGMTSENKPSRDVHVFDIASNTWATGPELPGEKMNGFGTAALAVDGKLYATGMDGNVYLLSADGKAWTSLGKLAHPRFFHRLVDGGDKSLLAIAGASMEEGHFDATERFSVAQPTK